MRFKKPSFDEVKQLVERLRGKTADEIIGILGQPAREIGGRTEERLVDGKPWVVEIRRTLTYFDVGPTIHRLRVNERVDGQCEFQMSGREISDEPSQEAAMPTEAPIAIRKLKATWRDGSTHDVTIEVSRPYLSGNSFRCRLRVTGLQQDYSPPDLAGFDEMQALTLCLGFVRFLLEWHLDEGGSLFYPDTDDPYTPDDLPKFDENGAA